MKKMIPLLLYGFALFGVSAGVGWFLRPQPTVEVVEETSDAVNPNLAETPDMPLPGTSPTVTEGTAGRTSPFGENRPSTDDRLPTAVRTEPMTVEEIVSMSLSLKKRHAALAQREEALQRTESQHQLLMADMQVEQREIETLLEQSKTQTKATEDLLQMVVATKQQTEAERARLDQDKKNFELELEKQKARAEKLNQELEFQRTPAEGESTDSPQDDPLLQARTMAPLIEGMSPEKASETLIEWTNNGGSQTVGLLLGLMDEKKASAIVQEVEDARLRQTMLESVRPKVTRTAKKR
ncbi:MAG: hypothetical protein KDA91_01515 [Planctomycetaceae bacterium]|nr:hypothetical protein [Planctomycetaceae bacterium]